MDDDVIRHGLDWAAGEPPRTHWQGCWRTNGHHACAIVLLERILASDTWAAECAEFGCTDPDHSSRYGASEC